MEQEPLFFEDANDALRYLVQSSGGAKKIGAELFPGKSPDQASRVLMDCMNSTRNEKLDIDQLIHLLRIGQQNGCNSAINFICGAAGYSQPTPITPADEAAQLQAAIVRGQQELTQALNRYNALRAGVK